MPEPFLFESLLLLPAAVSLTYRTCFNAQQPRCSMTFFLSLIIGASVRTFHSCSRCPFLIAFIIAAAAGSFALLFRRGWGSLCCALSRFVSQWLCTPLRCYVSRLPFRSGSLLPRTNQRTSNRTTLSHVFRRESSLSVADPLLSAASLVVLLSPSVSLGGARLSRAFPIDSAAAHQQRSSHGTPA
jgi:hypothetical protein